MSFRLLFAALMGCASSAGTYATLPESPAAHPPVAPVRPVVTDYFGVKVADDYRYFEDLQNPEVQAWMKAQAQRTRATLDALPGRQALHARMQALLARTPVMVSDVRVVGERCYSLRMPVGAQTPKLYVRDGLQGRDRLLVDPEKLAAAGAHVVIDDFSPSPDGRHVAYTLTVGGSEEKVLHVLDAASGKDLPGTLDRIGFADIEWLPDGQRLLYTRLKALQPGTPPSEKYHDMRLYLHKLGQAYSRDTAIAGTGISPASMQLTSADIPQVVLSADSHYALLTFSRGVDAQQRVFVAPVDAIGNDEIAWRTITPEYGNAFVRGDGNGLAAPLHGDTLYWLSREHADHGAIMRLDLSATDAKPQIAVAAGKLPISGVYAARDALYWRVSDAGIHAVWRMGYEDNAEPRRLRLPFPGNVAAVLVGDASPVVLLREMSWTRAPALLAVDARTGAVRDAGLQSPGADGHNDALVVEEIKVQGSDGTRVPLSIVRSKDTPLDGSAPLLLTGYGAYGVSMSPGYMPVLDAMYEQGVIYAVAHVRGGGEYGEAWHRGGFRQAKPNSWKDFIACAEYLVAHKYTSKARLGVMGRSAGGILIGRAIEERPDLFAAAVALVPAADMLRIETTPSGPPNVSEFGSVGTEAGFRALYAMSPYANVKDGTRYPAVLVTTGINDPRVAPWGPAKFAARLQAASSSGKPVLLRVDYGGGHGLGATLDQSLSEMADAIGFLLWQSGAPVFQPRGAVR